MAGLLEIRHPGQKPSVITPALQAKVLEATRRKSDGSTHWSCRKLAIFFLPERITDETQQLVHSTGSGEQLLTSIAELNLRAA